MSSLKIRLLPCCAALGLSLISCGPDTFQPAPVKQTTPTSSTSSKVASEARSAGTANQNAEGSAPGNEAGTPAGAPGSAPPPTNTVVTPNPAAPPPAGGPSTGSVALSFTPVRYTGANYQAFVYAVWVTDSGGRYVKTIDARAATRMRFLTDWLTAAGVAANAANAQNPDGNTGATLPYPATPTAISKTWDLKDKAGAVVPQGNYIINIQLTSSNNAGVKLQVPVTIGASGLTKADTSQMTGITAVSIKHTP